MRGVAHLRRDRGRRVALALTQSAGCSGDARAAVPRRKNSACSKDRIATTGSSPTRSWITSASPKARAWRTSAPAAAGSRSAWRAASGPNGIVYAEDIQQPDDRIDRAPREARGSVERQDDSRHVRRSAPAARPRRRADGRHVHATGRLRRRLLKRIAAALGPNGQPGHRGFQTRMARAGPGRRSKNASARTWSRRRPPRRADAAQSRDVSCGISTC